MSHFVKDEEVTNRLLLVAAFVVAMSVVIGGFILGMRSQDRRENQVKQLAEICSIAEDPAQCIVELRNG